MVSKSEDHGIGHRIRERNKRRIRSGEEFDSGDRDNLLLEEVPPDEDQPPEAEQVEPWGWGDKPIPPRLARALELYRETFPATDPEEGR